MNWLHFHAIESVHAGAHLSRRASVGPGPPSGAGGATDRLLIEDRGDVLLVRPLPADPIAAARGSLPLPEGLTSERLRALAREEEQAAEAEGGAST